MSIGIKIRILSGDDMNYSHVICGRCWGVVQLCNDMIFRCQECGEEVPLCGGDYDILMKNEKTGWIFPMLDKNRL